jgi:hypothetical protein
MDSDDWTIYNSLIATAKYDPVAHYLHLMKLRYTFCNSSLAQA